MSTQTLGVSGRIAAYFQSAQITPLLALVALLLGIFAVLVTPREEEPQINVTMANVLIPFPGASARDVERWSPPGRAGAGADRRHRARDSVSRPGLAVITVQFKVGVPRIRTLVRLYDTVNSNADWLPILGVRRRSSNPRHRRRAHRHVHAVQPRPATGAADLSASRTHRGDLKRVLGTREVTTIGGPGRAVRVEIDPARAWPRSGVTVADLRAALLSANLGLPVGDLVTGNRASPSRPAPFLATREVGELVVGGARRQAGVPARRRRRCVDGPPPPSARWSGTAGGGERAAKRRR